MERRHDDITGEPEVVESSSMGDVARDLGNYLGDVLDSVGGAVGDGVQAVGRGIEDIGQSVQRVGQVIGGGSNAWDSQTSSGGEGGDGADEGDDCDDDDVDGSGAGGGTSGHVDGQLDIDIDLHLNVQFSTAADAGNEIGPVDLGARPGWVDAGGAGHDAPGDLGSSSSIEPLDDLTNDGDSWS